VSDDNSFQSAPDELVIGGPEAPKSRKRWWIGGLALCLVGAGGGAAAWAAVGFFKTGEQPAAALPASTLGYVSIDLDPNGGQKIEALKLARKFPAFKEKVGLKSGDDLRKWIFDEIASDSGCSIDFAKDVEPWLGSRAAFAAVPVDGQDDPAPVAVLQVTDADKADAGLAKLDGCDRDDSEAVEKAWSIEGDWAVLADTQDIAQTVADEAKKGSLADDQDFGDWTSRVGDSGLVTAYASPAVGGVIADEISSSLDDLSADESCQDTADTLTGALTDFKGAAATLKLDDGGIELSAVADAGNQAVVAGPVGDSAVTSLPADTAVAYGLAMPSDWASTWQKQFDAACGAGTSSELDSFSDMLGFDILADGPKVIGDSLALAIGPDVDVEQLVNSGDPSALPIALKTTGQKDEVDKLLDSLSTSLGIPSGYLSTSGEDGGVVVALDPDYAKKVAGDGGLGDDASFRDVVPHAAESGGVLYVNFDQLDDAVKQLSSGERDVVDNIKPLKALGFSAWSEKSEIHAQLRVSLD
jgi:hypothetical protein